MNFICKSIIAQFLFEQMPTIITHAKGRVSIFLNWLSHEDKLFYQRTFTLAVFQKQRIWKVMDWKKWRMICVSQSIT